MKRSNYYIPPSTKERSQCIAGWKGSALFSDCSDAAIVLDREYKQPLVSSNLAPHDALAGRGAQNIVEFCIALKIAMIVDANSQ